MRSTSSGVSLRLASVTHMPGSTSSWMQRTRPGEPSLGWSLSVLHCIRLKHAQQRVQRSLGVFLSSTMLLFRPDARLRAAFLALLLAGLTPDPRSPIHRLAQRLSSFASSDTAQRRASGTWTQTLGLDQAPPLLCCSAAPHHLPSPVSTAPLPSLLRLCARLPPCCLSLLFSLLQHLLLPALLSA